MGKSQLSIENKVANVVIATDSIPYKDNSELHISLSAWCVNCLKTWQRKNPAVVIFCGNSLCEECMLDASVGDEC